jgi:hypothetical protein
VCSSDLSPPERECAKLFHKQFDWIPKERKNCHIKIGRYEYDFKLNGYFVEYHPKNIREKTREDMKFYYQKRRKNLDGKGHKNNKLFVLQNIEDAKDFCRFLKL